MSSSTGLRGKKKRRTRSAIIENAVALFRERGFEVVRIRDIAAPLELSDATFFNYFATKDAVLTEWVRDCVERAFLEAGCARSVPVRGVVRHVARSLAVRFEADAELLGKEWHRIRQSAGAAPGSARELVEGSQDRGELRADLPAEQLADLLVAGMLAAVPGWLDQPGAGALAGRFQRAADLVLDGGRKRNERVRAPAAGVPIQPS